LSVAWVAWVKSTTTGPDNVLPSVFDLFPFPFPPLSLRWPFHISVTHPIGTCPCPTTAVVLFSLASYYLKLNANEMARTLAAPHNWVQVQGITINANYAVLKPVPLFAQH